MQPTVRNDVVNESPPVARPLNVLPQYQPPPQPQDPAGMSTSIVGGSKLLQMMRRPTRHSTLKEKLKLVGYGTVLGLILAVVMAIVAKRMIVSPKVSVSTPTPVETAV
jgi:hypothetical protein